MTMSDPSNLYSGITNPTPYGASFTAPTVTAPAATLSSGLSPAEILATGGGNFGATALPSDLAGSASWLGGIGADAATAGGLAGRAAGFVRGPFGPAVLGTLASYGIKALPLGQGATSTQDVLANAAQAAGVGGTIGSFIEPGGGTAIGAGIGGALGAGGTILANIFGGPSTPTPQGNLRDTVGATAQAFGLSQDEYKNRFDTLVKLGMKDAQGNPLSQSDVANQLAQQVWSESAQTKQTNEQMAWQQAQHQADLKAGLALQAQARDFFSPYTNNIISAGASQAQVLNNLANQVPAAYKGVFQAQAANALNNSQQMAGAYAAQTALMPAQMAMAQTAQANASQLADQAKLYQYASMMRGQAGAGGGTNLVSQLQQAGGAYNQQAAGGPYGTG
jgi:hypothetical protein